MYIYTTHEKLKGHLWERLESRTVADVNLGQLEHFPTIINMLALSFLLFHANNNEIVKAYRASIMDHHAPTLEVSTQMYKAIKKIARQPHPKLADNIEIPLREGTLGVLCGRLTAYMEAEQSFRTAIEENTADLEIYLQAIVFSVLIAMPSNINSTSRRQALMATCGYLTFAEPITIGTFFTGLGAIPDHLPYAPIQDWDLFGWAEMNLITLRRSLENDPYVYNAYGWVCQDSNLFHSDGTLVIDYLISHTMQQFADSPTTT